MPVDPQQFRFPGVITYVVALSPCPHGIGVDGPGVDAGSALPVNPKPQLLTLIGRGEGTKQGAVAQPLLQQPDRVLGQGHAFWAGTAFDVGQQDRGMRAGWAKQQLGGRGLAPGTVKQRRAVVCRFLEHAGEYPWNWTAAHLDEWSEDLVGVAGKAKSTIRNHHDAVRSFESYLV